MVKDNTQHILRTFLLSSPSWKEGYHSFRSLLGEPKSWIIEVMGQLPGEVITLEPGGYDKSYLRRQENRLRKSSVKFVKDGVEKFPKRISAGRFPVCYVFALRHLDSLKGFLVLCSADKHWAPSRTLVSAFKSFLNGEVDLAYRNYELRNFYETIHPRALALSTMHSLHRAMSSALRLDELLPRIGRLSMQVLKARSCSILLVDESKKYLVPRFVCKDKIVSKHKVRHRIGRGIEGTVVETGAFHLSRRAMSIPLIEEDVIGVITLRDKTDKAPFTKIDLEVFRALCEQASVAIRSAQLYEETEQLTLGSIKSINELLELSYTGDFEKLPLFKELTAGMGKDLSMTQEEVKNLDRAVALLNTGYIGMPQRILAKRGTLTKKEVMLIHRHPYRGAAVLRSVSSFKPIVPIVLRHHEHYDGTGYPSGLKGENIPLGARIVAVVDAFTAMISPRPYRSPKGMEEAVHEIREQSGKQFDPKVVKSFLKIIEKKLSEAKGVKND